MKVKLVLAAMCMAVLAGCGASKDKAEKLVEAQGIDKQYKMIVDISTLSYSRKYPSIESNKIKSVIEGKLSKDDLKNAMVKVYADNLDSDELDLILEANKHPERAMAIILGSKDGQALATKMIEVQKDMMRDMQKAMSDVDEAIDDDLKDLQSDS